MKEAGMLFTDDMVQAILDGRKRVTRRLVKFPKGFEPGFSTNPIGSDGRWFFSGAGSVNVVLAMSNGMRCPFGGPGDRIWVRESWNVYERLDEDLLHLFDKIPKTRPKVPHALVYRASDAGDFDWRPSIHMPRWACRLELPIVSIRPERVQDITEADAKAEGVAIKYYHGAWCEAKSYRDAFLHLWEGLYWRKGLGFDANPWVWRIEFGPARVLA